MALVIKVQGYLTFTVQTWLDWNECNKHLEFYLIRLLKFYLGFFLGEGCVAVEADTDPAAVAEIVPVCCCSSPDSAPPAAPELLGADTVLDPLLESGRAGGVPAGSLVVGVAAPAPPALTGVPSPSRLRRMDGRGEPGTGKMIQVYLCRIEYKTRTMISNPINIMVGTVLQKIHPY